MPFNLTQEISNCRNAIGRHIRNKQNLKSAVIALRNKTLELSKLKEFQPLFSGSPHVLDLESKDERYLINGSSDGSIWIYDTEFCPAEGPSRSYPVVGAVKRTSKHAHQFMVSSCQWYPFDTGMFVTTGTDKNLKIWDSNHLKPVDTISFEFPITQQHWAPVAGPKRVPLIAVAAGISNVLLVDIKTGSWTQQLKGHKEQVTCVQWSPRDANILLSAGKDGKILVWDVRSGRKHLKSLTHSMESEKRTRRRTNKKLNHQNFNREAKRNIDKGSSTYEVPPLSKLNSDSFAGRSHSGAVCGLKFTSDGQHLVTTGTEGRIKVWDSMRMEFHSTFLASSFENLMGTKTTASFELAGDGKWEDALMYLPLEDNIELFHLATGRSIKTLSGHYNPVTSCVLKKRSNELFSGGNDRNLLVWTPEMDRNSLYQEERSGGQKNLDALTMDQWSDDD